MQGVAVFNKDEILFCNDKFKKMLNCEEQDIFEKLCFLKIGGNE